MSGHALLLCVCSPGRLFDCSQAEQGKSTAVSVSPMTERNNTQKRVKYGGGGGGGGEEEREREREKLVVVA